MLKQIKIWMNTGFHPKDKIISLWDTTARAISKGKAGKTVEFGRRWIITRLIGGYDWAGFGVEAEWSAAISESAADYIRDGVPEAGRLLSDPHIMNIQIVSGAPGSEAVPPGHSNFSLQ